VKMRVRSLIVVAYTIAVVAFYFLCLTTTSTALEVLLVVRDNFHEIEVRILI
jgi:hypothetical protein